MRTAALLAGAALLLATACTEKPKYGCTPAQAARGECLSQLPTGSPTPTPSRTRPSVTPSTSRPPSTPPPAPAPQGRTYPIVIRDSANGYDPHDLRLRRGDSIVFTNLDASSKHSFTGDKGEWDSGELSEGERYTLKVTLAPGRYTFKCTVVPYVLGGPIEVLAS